MNVYHELPSQNLSGWVALDLELTETNVKVLHRPQGGKFALLSMYDGKDVYLIHEEREIQPAIETIRDCTWILHNAKFDLTHLRRWAYIPPRKKIWDTMLIEKILWSGFYDGFGLNDLSRRYLDRYLDKTLQDKWEKIDPTNIPQNYIDYAAQDVITTYDICQVQKRFVSKQDFKIWTHIDLPVMWAVMDFMGFRIDAQKWMDLSVKNKARAKEIDETLPFNPRSPKVAREYLSKRGFRGLSNTQESTLELWIDRYPDCEAADLAKTALEARKYYKRASTYGNKFIEDHVEQDLVHKVDAVYGDYNISGAETGRFSCSSPNMQNIPIRDTREFRECFIARPGYKLIDVDYSQQEIGIAAYISKDKKLLDIFNSGKDIYIQMAKVMYGKTISKDDPLRKRMKSVVLGTNYGMSAVGLAMKEKITEDEAGEFLNKFANAFPQMSNWMNQQQKLRSYTKTILGRKTWLNPYMSQSYRNALNNPIQGSAADMMKLALIELHRNWNKLDIGIPFSVVAAIHDEIVMDVPEGDAFEIAGFVEKCTVDAANKMCTDIPMKFKADVSIGNTWADKE